LLQYSLELLSDQLCHLLEDRFRLLPNHQQQLLHHLQRYQISALMQLIYQLLVHLCLELKLVLHR